VGATTTREPLRCGVPLDLEHVPLGHRLRGGRRRRAAADDVAHRRMNRTTGAAGRPQRYISNAMEDRSGRVALNLMAEGFYGGGHPCNAMQARLL